ncbi:hypothetical protein Sm713_64300 [Streptomyces sp. TS71-3]|nr:hypothetical protein Sm713_64300 [Streptomyces sp. TS71-3]
MTARDAGVTSGSFAITTATYYIASMYGLGIYAWGTQDTQLNIEPSVDVDY